MSTMWIWMALFWKKQVLRYLSFVSNSCFNQKIKDWRDFELSQIDLGLVQTKLFDDFLLIPLSKKWLEVNEGNSLDFEVKLIEGQLVLSAKLESLERTKEVVKNEMWVIIQKSWIQLLSVFWRNKSKMSILWILFV